MLVHFNIRTLRHRPKSVQIAPMEQRNQHDILIQTLVNYQPEQSDESGSRFVFSYTITITNLGSNTAKLISRHWIITDAHNHVQEVRGQGVVGEQPLRIHQRHRLDYAGRHDAWQLPDANCRRRTV